MSIWERRLERSGKSASAASSEVINKKKSLNQRGKSQHILSGLIKWMFMISTNLLDGCYSEILV